MKVHLVSKKVAETMGLVDKFGVFKAAFKLFDFFGYVVGGTHFGEGEGENFIGLKDGGAQVVFAKSFGFVPLALDEFFCREVKFAFFYFVKYARKCES